VPVELHINALRRLSEQIEVAIYYIVSEALTNVLKHANASVMRVDLAVEGQRLRLSIRDDGHGGADLGRGSGLIGLTDRVAALDGTMHVTSPIGEGTSLLITIPVEHA
jgi:signal transduction histidine kinase